MKTKRETIENIDGEINYVKEKLPKMDREKSEGRKEWHEGYLVAMKEARNKVNQLDEPETLSQEWITKHTTGADALSHYSDEDVLVVQIKDLQNLLVPKQEEPTQEQVQKYLSEHGIEVVEKEPETVADVITDFYKSLERMKKVLSMEVEELEE